MQPSVLDQLNQQNSGVASNLGNASQAIAQTNQQPSSQNPVATPQGIASPAPTDQSQSTQPKSSGDGGNWLTKLLPTLGSIAAPVIGGILAPETGGLSLLGGLALAGGGSAAGKVAENAAEGQDLTKDVGASALEGAGGQLMGGAVGKVGSAILGKAGEGAGNAAVGMVQKQFGDQIDKATAQHLVDHGLTSRADAVNMANQVTGSEGHLPQAINNAFQASDKTVNVADLDPTAIKGSDNSSIFNMDKAGLTPQGQKTALANTEAVLNSSMGPGDLSQLPTKGAKSTVPLYANGSLQNALPENVFGMGKQFEKLGYSADATAYDKAGNTINPQQAALGTYYKGIANELNSRAFGVGQEAIPLTDEVKQSIAENLAPLQQSNPQAFQKLTDQIGQAQNLQDLRSIQAPWVKVAQGDRVASAIENGQGGVSAGDMLSNAAPIVGGATGGVKGLATGMMLKAMNSPAGNAAGAGTLDKMSGILSNPNLQKIVTQAATVPAQTLTHAPTDFTGAAGAGQALQVPGQNPALSNPNLEQEVMNSNNLSALPIQAALNFNMHRQVGDNQNYMAAPGVEQNLGTLQGGIGAESQLPALIQAFNAAGGAQGALGGGLANLGGLLTGGPAAQYQQRANELQKSIQAATGQNVAMPTLGMNQPAAQSAIQQLLAVLNSSGTPSAIPAMAQ